MYKSNAHNVFILILINIIILFFHAQNILHDALYAIGTQRVNRSVGRECHVTCQENTSGVVYIHHNQKLIYSLIPLQFRASVANADSIRARTLQEDIMSYFIDPPQEGHLG